MACVMSFERLVMPIRRLRSQVIDRIARAHLNSTIRPDEIQNNILVKRFPGFAAVCVCDDLCGDFRRNMLFQKSPLLFIASLAVSLSTKAPYAS